ncbi:MAG TPA: hypothetical protein VH107_15425 [Lacipirellulaceae bacterium]|nr:hypothetical protein [Lacipirellulaceae bacterium]
MATFARPAAAQNFGFRGRDFDKTVDRGYTDEELIAEKKLLLDKSRSITWEVLPFIEFPRRKPAPASQPLPGQPQVTKFSELPQSKIEAAQKTFVDTKLKGRVSGGLSQGRHSHCFRTMRLRVRFSPVLPRSQSPSLARQCIY